MDTISIPLEILFFVLVTQALTFGSYFAARYVLLSRSSVESKDLSSSVIFRIAALQGLILALVFAQELINFTTVRDVVNREATDLEEIYFDIARFENAPVDKVRVSIANYVSEVVNTEWEILGKDGSLSDAAWAYREEILQELLDLEPQNSRQTWLRDTMLERIRAVGHARNDREIAAVTDVNVIFWVVAFVGVILVATPYFVYPPNRTNLALLSIFAVYTGLVLYFIHTLDQPFARPGFVQPVALELLYEEFLKDIPLGGEQGSASPAS